MTGPDYTNVRANIQDLSAPGFPSVRSINASEPEFGSSDAYGVFVSRLPRCEAGSAVGNVAPVSQGSGPVGPRSLPVAPATPRASVSSTAEYERLLRSLHADVIALEVAHWTTVSQWDCLEVSLSRGMVYSSALECRNAQARMEIAVRQAEVIASGGVLPSRSTTFHDVYGNEISSYAASVEYARYQTAVLQLAPASRRQALAMENLTLAGHTILGDTTRESSLGTCVDDAMADSALTGDQIANQSAICQMAALNIRALLAANAASE